MAVASIGLSALWLKAAPGSPVVTRCGHCRQLASSRDDQQRTCRYGYMGRLFDCSSRCLHERSGPCVAGAPASLHQLDSIGLSRAAVGWEDRTCKSTVLPTHSSQPEIFRLHALSM